MDRTPDADAVAALWAQVVAPGADVGPDTELAELGADSLDTARVLARLRRAHGLAVPFREAFEAATPRALAAVAREHGVPVAPASAPDDRDGGVRGVPGAGGGLGVTDADGRSVWPLSHDQQRLWLVEQRGHGGAAYHLAVALRLRGPLDVDALRGAWADVVARHGSFRTRFVMRDHEPRQEILTVADVAAQCALPTVDVPAPTTAEDAVADLVAPPFDLEAAPPWRACVLRAGADDHVFTLVVHHVLFDGWSEEVLRRELAAQYAPRAADRGSGAVPLPEPAAPLPELPELPTTYARHAAAERARDHDPALDERLAWWRATLAGSTPLDLPADHQRSATWTDAGAAHDFTIDPGLAGRVRTLARAHGASSFMALLAAWDAVLATLCGTTDVVVGASTADRGDPDLEGVVGMFVNVLVIRADLGGRPSFAELLGRVRAATIDAFERQDTPFDRLVAELAPDRAAARNPLFNVNFVYLNMPVADDVWPGLTVERVRPPVRATAFDLILAVQDQADGSMTCHLEHSAALFDRATVTRIEGQLRRVLAAAVADPDVPVAAIDVLGDDERRALVAASTGPAAPLPDACLHTLVEQAARRAPDAIAVAFPGTGGGAVELTYAQLDARANKLAWLLRGGGVDAETAVAIRLPRGVDQVVAMLAVWKAGGHYVPLDDEHPPDRIASMLADARPLILVTRGPERVSTGEAAGVAKIVCLDRDRADVDAQPATPPDAGVTPDGLAAAIYTSGSTGVPKAVALSHRNVVSALVTRDAFDAPPRSLLLPVSFAFDVFLSFAAWTLTRGGRLVIPAQARGADLDELAGLLREHAVTTFVGPPDLQRALLARPDVRDGGTLRLGIVGGQSCPRVLGDDHARAGGSRLVNEYGLTETSAGTFLLTSGEPVDPAAAAADPALLTGQLPIGRPGANYRVLLLDADLRLVPAGVVAEVHVGGPGVARGYVDRPAATADRFVPDPFGAPGERLYRTGDLARRRLDGTLEFLGRRDRQVKIRGFRIELAEVEAALLRHRDVGAAAVVFLPERAELVAFVTGGLSVAAAREHAAALLPDSMVPAAFVPLDAMPLTPNGKIDRAALAELAAERATTGPAATVTPPRTPMERAIAAVWADALGLDVTGDDGGPTGAGGAAAGDVTASGDVAGVAGLDRFDVEADFFDLGGHSLLAATVVSRLRADLGVRLAMADLFAHPTVAGLAGVLAERGAAAATAREHPAHTLDDPRAPLARLLLDTARRTPDAPAVWADGATVTYREFAGGAIRLARRLVADGVRPGDVVGVRLPRGVEQLAAVHAAALAGAAYLPLPPDLPAARLAMMIEDAAPALVLDDAAAIRDVTAAPVTAAPTTAAPVTAGVGTDLADAELADLDRAAAGLPGLATPPGVPAYVIFTSGSTGRPKGVVVPQGAVVELLGWLQRTFALTAADRVLLKTPFSFDVAVPELFWPLAVGAGVAVVPDGGHRDVDQLATVARDSGATVAQFVPSVLALFLDTLPDGGGAPLPELRLVLAAGEALPADLVTRFAAALPHVELHNLYGPTEATVYATWHACEPGESPVPIGRALDGVRAVVLDADGARVPAGDTGELCLGGPQVAHGYTGRPDLTADRFVPDPHGVPGERLYRTGDLARERRDGTLEYLGRADGQLKIRGVRIEPGEVEAALREHPAVAAAVVLPWRTASGELRLVAHVVAHDGAEPPSAGQARAFLRDRLPAAMIPARYAPLAALPLTPSGKIDRAALAGPAAAAPTGALTWLRPTAPADGATAPPLVCVHSGDGAASWYTHLARVLGDRPVAAFEWPVGTGAGVAATARRYLAELRRAVPTGPYRVLGWCGGAPVTWELARLLDEAGDAVDLWLLDPVVDVALRPETTRQLAQFRDAERMFADLDADPDRTAAARRRGDLVEALRLSLDDPGVPVGEADVRRRAHASRELLEAGVDYDYRPFRGGVRLVTSEDFPHEEHVTRDGGGFDAYLARWAGLARGGVRRHAARGTHFAVLRPPHVDALAALLTEEDDAR